MTASEVRTYWYAGDGAASRGRQILHALRMYQAAEVAMRRRTRSAMGMGENELLALRYVIRAGTQQRTVTPTDVSKYLGISTASTTALLDRLEAAGHVVRHRHPTDRRSVQLAVTASADESVRATLGAMHERMMGATREIDDTEAAAIVAFLERMTDAVDQVSTGRT